jgi:1,4-dihydroxy-6-naphthoate synthase
VNAPALRVAISPCPNDVFIFAGWILGKTPAPRATFVYEDIETLNGFARDVGASNLAFDLIKISYANIPQCPDYFPLGCGGALGRGCGPLLLTGGAPFNPDAEVLVPGEHTTANFLLDFWFQKSGLASQSGVTRKLRKRFVPFDALYRELRERPDAQGVVIHEMRFTYARDGLSLVRDLGEHWEAVTGGPIPLGAVVYRGGVDLPASPEIETAIRASLDWAWAHEEEALALCALHAQDMDPVVMRSHIDLYVNAFSRELGLEGAAAVDFFLKELAVAHRNIS